MGKDIKGAYQEEPPRRKEIGALCPKCSLLDCLMFNKNIYDH